MVMVLLMVVLLVGLVRYQILDLLGKGTFGQVVRCLDHDTGDYVAIKIVRVANSVVL